MLTALALISSTLAAGPHAVGFVDRAFRDPVADRVATRVYYPTSVAGRGEAPTGGPYPLAVFLHGWLGQAWMYDTMCEDLASWGWVVVSLDTETGLLLDMERFADDGVAALHGVEEASADPQDLLHGVVSDEPWTALGHSMGGATLSHLLGLEPRIRTAVAFMPYEGADAYYDELSAYEGSYLLLSGTHDTTAPPALQREWMAVADRTRRSLWLNITDMGHQAVTDLSPHEDPMADDLQLEIVSRLSTAFIRAEHHGEEDQWEALFGPSMDALDVAMVSRSHEPALWATLDGQTVDLGAAGLPESTGEVFLGTAVAEDGLQGAVSVGALDLPTGVARVSVEVPAGWAGDLLVRVRLDGPEGPAWTRPVVLASDDAEPAPPADEPASEGPPAPEAPSADPETSSSGAEEETAPGGCATTRAPAGWSILLLLGLRRRTR